MINGEDSLCIRNPVGWQYAGSVESGAAPRNRISE